MPEFLSHMLTAYGGQAAMLAIASFLFRAYINHRLAKEEKKFEAKFSQEIENLKAELSIEAHKRNVSNSRIDTQRSDAIADLWESMTGWKNQLDEIKHMDELPPETLAIMQAGSFVGLAENLAFKTRNIASMVSANTLIFDEDVHGKLSTYSDEVVRISKKFNTALAGHDHARPLGDQPEFLSRTKEAMKGLLNEANQSAIPLHYALTKKFRALMIAKSELINK